MKQHFPVELSVLPQTVRFDLLNLAAVSHEVVRHQEAADREEDIHQQRGVADYLVAHLFGVVEHQGRVLDREKRVPLHVEAQDQEAADGPRGSRGVDCFGLRENERLKWGEKKLRHIKKTPIFCFPFIRFRNDFGT